MKISIIVPIYNAEKYIDVCLDSLVSQTYKNYEIILVNDGSQENEEEIIYKYMLKHKNIFYYKKKNGGQASARNYGLSKITGDYIMFVDSDDYLDKNILNILSTEIKKYKYDILCFDFNKVLDNRIEKYNTFLGLSNDIISNYIISDPSPCNKIFNSILFKDNSIRFTEGRIYEDLAIIPTLACYTNKIGYINKYLYNYVIHDNSTMRQIKYNDKLKDIFFALDYLYDKFMMMNQYEKFCEEIEYIFIEHLLHGASLRLYKYKEAKNDLKNITLIMKKKFPDYRHNEYFKLRNWKYRLICNLFYHNKINIVQILLK